MVRLTVTRLYILCFILFFSFGCEQNSHTNTLQEGIEEWKKKEFIVERYNTLAGTFATVSDYSPVVVRHVESSDVEVKWYLNNNPITDIEIETKWISDSNIWQSVYKPVWKNYELKKGDLVRAEIILNQKKIEQNATISEEIIERDILGVNFGMSFPEVRKAETRRAKLEIDELESTLWKDTEFYSLLWYSSNFSEAVTLYYFSEEGLTKVGEFTYVIENVAGETEINKKLIELCYKYGLEEEIQLNENKIPIKDYVWNNGLLQFRLEYLSEIPVSKNGDDTCAGLGIIYEAL